MFNIRPMSQELIAYCLQEVQILIEKWMVYNKRMSVETYAKLDAETRKRIVLSHSSGYNGKGRHMALSGM